MAGSDVEIGEIRQNKATRRWVIFAPSRGKRPHDFKQDILSRLYIKLNDPHYNYVINTSGRYRADEPQLHWYLQILPRLTLQAGFEIGSGMSINPSMPEEDALFLKE